MGPTWVLSAPDGPHIGPMNLANRDTLDAVVTSAVAFAASATGTDHHDDKTAVAHDVDNQTILETLTKRRTPPRMDWGAWNCLAKGEVKGSLAKA